MRFSMIAVFGLLFLNACASGRVVVADGDPAPPAPHRVQGPVAVLGIPPGHYPPPGECRVWIPGTPPGHQPEPCACFSLAHQVPPGAWVLYRPVDDETIVEVTTYDASQPTSIISVAWYDAGSGKYLRSGKAGKHEGQSKHGKSKSKGKSK